eukprot:5313124-Karenia_brevis.AAC.1
MKNPKLELGYPHTHTHTSKFGAGMAPGAPQHILPRLGFNLTLSWQHHGPKIAHDSPEMLQQIQI